MDVRSFSLSSGLLVALVCVISLIHVTLSDPNVEFTLEEEKVIGTEVGSLGDDTVLPLGLEASVRKSLGYNLLPLGFPRSSLFRVDQHTGQIFTKARIDRESLCTTDRQCDLDIQVAVQSAVSQFFKKVRVTIRVQDINDNSPAFPRQTTTLNILESAAVGTNFPLESATDLDIGTNGVRDYELAPNDGPFYVNLTRVDNEITMVSLVLRQELDRETKSNHRMLLTARDGGQPPRSGSMTILVNIEDVNDNPPVFDRSLYNVTMPEIASAGTPVVTVSATDQDTDQYNIKEYRFAPLDREDVTKYFAINGSTGQITVSGSLLEKQGDTFRILVECLDKGVPPLVSRAEVDVTVEDTVNSAPIVSVNIMFGGSVSELAQSGTVVALVGVLDRDAGLNGLVSCSIVSDAFELQPLSVNEYKVIVVRKLDREVEPVLNVTVTCEDAGSPKMSSSVNFEVKVKDENDNFPVFTESFYQKSIPENNRQGQVILKVTATDADYGENGRVSYSLLGVDDELLRIDTRGSISAVKSLDHEVTPLLKFKVVAMDNGVDRKSSTAEVIIEITDLNDEVPTFEKSSYEFEVSENMSENTTVGSVLATDRDSGDNGKIVYSLLPKLSPFIILSNGLIVTKDILDREQRDSYTITVYAEDKGRPPLTGSTTVMVKIGDQNDHRPRIIYPRSGNSTVAVSFDAKPGSVVLSILAEDEDEGANKELEYILASNTASSIFKLTKDKGELILQRVLTPQDSGRHRLTVVVTDKSSAFPLFTNSTFDVIIFAPNETEAQSKDKEKEHVLVVIILGVVTGVVTVAVIITIVVIRRADAQRRKYHHSRAKMVSEVEKLESDKKTVGYVISNSVSDGTKTRGSHDGSEDMTRDNTQDEGFGDKS
ncbi:protocadherin-11 X-linked, partial [Biomphalaria pfeifferi]